MTSLYLNRQKSKRGPLEASPFDAQFEEGDQTPWIKQTDREREGENASHWANKKQTRINTCTW